MKTAYLGFDPKQVTSWSDALDAPVEFQVNSRAKAVLKGKAEKRIVFAFQVMSDGALVVKSSKPVVKPC